MDIIEDKSRVVYKTAVALGNFDGIHLGHIELIKKCRSVAKAKGLKLMILTFDRKLTELKSGNGNACLTSRTQKEKVFRELGVDMLYILKFDENVKQMSPDCFIEDILVNRLNASEIFVGFNFKFGYGAKGNPRLLSERGEELGFNTTVIEPIKVAGEIASSSAIREYLRGGYIDKANTLLGRAYEIRGSVVRGKGRGKVMGFATANLKPEVDYLPPKFGVYKTLTSYKGEEFISLTNVGENPTFGDVSFSIETHILDFEDDIYDETIEVRFIKYIREEVKFSTVDSLISQVKSDIAEIKRGN